MCVSRSGFLGAFGAAAALPLFAEPARALDQVQTDAGTAGEVLVAPVGLTSANRRAAEIASNSPFVRVQNAQCYAMAQAIGDMPLGDALILLDPTPKFMRVLHAGGASCAPRWLARDGLWPRRLRFREFSPLTCGIAQPFWSAPGSDTNGHHSYPGGLCVHELFNARMATQFAQSTTISISITLAR